MNCSCYIINRWSHEFLCNFVKELHSPCIRRMNHTQLCLMQLHILPNPRLGAIISQIALKIHVTTYSHGICWYNIAILLLGYLWLHSTQFERAQITMAATLQVSDFTGKQFQFESKNYPNHFIRHQNWRVYMHKHQPTQLYQLDSTFDIIPGIAGQGISFRSINYPAYFLRHKGGSCFIHSADGSQLFKDDASWIPCQGLADPNGVSFESMNFPRHYLRHRNSRLQKDEINNSQLFKEDATWYPRLLKDVSIV